MPKKTAKKTTEKLVKFFAQQKANDTKTSNKTNRGNSTSTSTN
jgi:hypothetical protein